MSFTFTSQAIVNTVPLKDRIQFGTYSYTAVDNNIDTDDYMLVSNHWYSTMAETIWASDGETSAGVGTSYLDLSGSCVLGDYASESGSWSEYAFLERTYSSTVTYSGDSVFVVGTNCTAPSLSAGSSSTYISMQMAGDQSADSGSTAETITFTADAWFDADSDGNDDSATDDAEDYIHFGSDVYIYYAIKVVASDVDVALEGYITLGFYVDQSTTYDVKIATNGGVETASSFTSDWTYTGATSATLDYFEAEADWVHGVFSLAELIADDTDSTPVVSGLDWIKMSIETADNWGDGSSDTVDFYVGNVAVFNRLPAFTKNDPSTDVDFTGDATGQTFEGDSTYYTTHDILEPYVAVASDNTFNSKIYLDADLTSGTGLLLDWHTIKLAGTAILDAISGSVTTQAGDAPNIRQVNLNYDFNQLRISDGDEITSTFAPTYSSATFTITTDFQDFYSAEKDFDEDIIYAEVAGVEKTSDFSSALANQNDNTNINLFTFSTAPSSGITNIYYEYYTQESKEIVPAQFFQRAGQFIATNWIWFLSGGLATLGGIAFILVKRK